MVGIDPCLALLLSCQVLTFHDGSLGKIGDHGGSELLRLGGSRLAERDEIGDGAGVHDRTLVVNVRAEVPDAPRGHFLRNGRAQPQHREQWRDATGSQDRPLHLLVAVGKIGERCGGLLLNAYRLCLHVLAGQRPR